MCVTVKTRSSTPEDIGPCGGTLQSTTLRSTLFRGRGSMKVPTMDLRRGGGDPRRRRTVGEFRRLVTRRVGQVPSSVLSVEVTLSFYSVMYSLSSSPTYHHRWVLRSTGVLKRETTETNTDPNLDDNLHLSYPPTHGTRSRSDPVHTIGERKWTTDSPEGQIGVVRTLV